MPAEAGISGGSRLDLFSHPPEMPAFAGMTDYG